MKQHRKITKYTSAMQNDNELPTEGMLVKLLKGSKKHNIIVQYIGTEILVYKLTTDGREYQINLKGCKFEVSESRVQLAMNKQVINVGDFINIETNGEINGHELAKRLQLSNMLSEVQPKL